MTNEIIYGISHAIDQEFGEAYTIYTETVEQGLEAPCFFIVCTSPISERYMGKRYKNQYAFCIQYFTESENRKLECNAITERLQDCLEYINVDGTLFYGSNMQSQYTEGILTFYVNYNFFTYKLKNEDRNRELMGQLELNQTGGN